MKRIILIFAMLLILPGLMVFQGCKEESIPFEVHHAFTIPELVAPVNNSFLSPAGTTVELKWSSTNADGAPENWDIYFGGSEEPGKVKSGHTSQSYTVTVQPGKKYYWKVIGYDFNKIPSRSQIWSFEIIDPTAPLKLNMNWATNVADAVGLDLDPKQAVNLRLLIRKADFSAYKTVNTTAFEEFLFDSSVPDGKYYIGTSIASTIDAGDFNAPIDIDINLTFAQKGILGQQLAFPKVMTNSFVCSTYLVYLATVVKSGNTYTVNSEVIYPVSPYSAVWYGIDAEYDSEVETYLGCGLQLKGLMNGWMLDFWGEIIVEGGSLAITIDEATGAVTIPEQYYCTTTYNGAVQAPYNIVGTGTYDDSGTYPTMKLKYSLIQDGTDIGQLCVDYGIWPVPYFEADLTADPAGLKSARITFNKPSKPLVKPVRK